MGIPAKWVGSGSEEGEELVRIHKKERKKKESEIDGVFDMIIGCGFYEEENGRKNRKWTYDEKL